MDVNFIFYLLLIINAVLMGVVVWQVHKISPSQPSVPVDRSKEDFLAMISHEIRTPLNGIIGFADVLSRTRLDEKQNECVVSIQDSGRGLLRILNDILDMSKAQAGKLQIVSEVIDVRSVVKSVFDLFRPLYQKNRNRVSLRLSDTIPDMVMSDEIRLRQVLSNLLSNAAKYTQDGAISCDVRCEDDKIIFNISDTGIGIAADRQSAIFEPFEQESESTSREFGGTGLGLSITKKIVELMNGTITLVSEQGKGSQFIVTLPLHVADQEETIIEEEEDDHAVFFHHHILIVEDIPMNQNLTRVLLEKRGCTVVIAENGEEAIEKISQEIFDLVLMDVRMPVMDGLTATRKIREKTASRLLPIIGMTAHAEGAEMRECLEAGMDDVLSKPVEASVLYKTLADWLYRDDDSFMMAANSSDEQQGKDLNSFDVLNLPMVNQFIEFLGQDGLTSALKDTRIDIDERVQKIRDAHFSSDVVYNEMHAISSMVGNIGLGRLSMLCRRIMHEAADVDDNARRKLIHEFETLWDHSRETLEYYLTRK